MKSIETDYEQRAITLANSLAKKGIKSGIVLAAIRTTLRHCFIDESERENAYEDHPLSIGYLQTISQPYIVARMTELLIEGKKLNKVLEIGTGAAYQSAILSQIVPEVYSMERIKALYDLAQQRLKSLNYQNIFLKYGDGYEGWQEHAPYDGIIVTARAPFIPEALLEQLSKEGGRMIIPVGEEDEEKLHLITREDTQYCKQILENVRFVPMLIGKE